MPYPLDVRDKLPLRTVRLLVTGTNWTTINAIGFVFKTLDGQFWLQFDILGNISVGTTGITLTIAGVTFKSGNLHAGAGAGPSGAGGFIRVFAGNGTGTLSLNSGSNMGADTAVNGCIPLNTEPTI